MPDTICRICGTDLSTQTKCEECLQIIREICPNCQYTPLEKFHFNCIIMSGIQCNDGKKIKEVLAA